MFKRFSLLIACIVSSLSLYADSPNVLFIVTDDLNENLGAFGHPTVQTPQLDSLANQSLRFERAYCQWPVCGPSRASFLTGLYPDQTGIKDLYTAVRDKLPEAVTLPQHFMNNGYHSARVGKLYHISNPNGIGSNGEDDPLSWEVRFNPEGVDNSTEVRNEIYILNNSATAWQSGGWTSTGARISYLDAQGVTSGGVDKGDPLEHTDGKVATQAVELIADYTENAQPFFLAVGFFKPHTPFVAPKQFFDLYDPDDIVIPDVPEDYFSSLPAAAVALLTERAYQNGLDPVLAKQTILAYYASISFMDAQIGRVLDALDDPNGDGDPADSIRDNTIIVFLSDHGYHLGEHDHYQKKTLFEDAARAPLMISVPGMTTGGQSTQSLAEMIDLYKTLADLAGLPEPEGISGTSLAPLITTPTATVRSSALTQVDNDYTLRTERYRYTRWNGGGTGKIELYDHQTDPQELNNLASSAPTENTALIADLDAQLSLRIQDAQPSLGPDPFPGAVDSSPFGGTARNIPGRIEAEEYDQGGEGIAYHDLIPGNNLTGTAYRNEDVDIAICTDSTGGFNIGGFDSGEWLTYTVDVAAGVYDLSFRLASDNTNNLADIEVYLEGSLLGKISAPATGGWQSWQTVTLNDVTVTPGGKNRKLVLRRSTSGEKFNLNWVEFSLKSTSFQLWKTHFDTWQAADPAPTGNDDNDTASNWTEYVFDSDPTDPEHFPDLSLIVTAALPSGQLSYRRQKFDPGITYTPRWSTDLTHWYTTGFIEQSVTDQGATEEVILKKNFESGHAQLFLKIEANEL